MLHIRCSILPVGVTPWIRMDLLPMNSLWGTTQSNPASHTKQQIGSDLMILTIVMSKIYVVIPDDSLYDNTICLAHVGSCFLDSRVLERRMRPGKRLQRELGLWWSGWLLCASFSQGSGHQITKSAENHHGFFPKGTCCYQRDAYLSRSIHAILASCILFASNHYWLELRITYIQCKWTVKRLENNMLEFGWLKVISRCPFAPLHRQQSDRLACWGGWWDFVGYL